jgi:hypothetical protein
VLAVTRVGVASFNVLYKLYALEEICDGQIEAACKQAGL